MRRFARRTLSRIRDPTLPPAHSEASGRAGHIRRAPTTERAQRRDGTSTRHGMMYPSVQSNQTFTRASRSRAIDVHRARSLPGAGCGRRCRRSFDAPSASDVLGGLPLKNVVQRPEGMTQLIRLRRGHRPCDAQAPGPRPRQTQRALRCAHAPSPPTPAKRAGPSAAEISWRLGRPGPLTGSALLP